MNRLCWIILFSASALGSDGIDFVRMNRGIESLGNIYVASFVERGPHVIAPDPLTVKTSTRDILNHQVQPWKLQKYFDTGLIDPRTDQAFIDILETIETLSRNTSILFIRRYWREKDVTGIYHAEHAGMMNEQGLLRSKLVGLIALAKLDLEHDEFPTEDRFQGEGLHIPRSELITLTPDLTPEPLWIPGSAEIQTGEQLALEPVVLNSHLAEENVRWLMYVLARSHGMFSYGRIIPPGVTAEIQGEKMTGPVAIEAGPFLVEAVGRLYKRLWEQEGFVTLASIAGLDFGDIPGRDRTSSLLSMEREKFMGEYIARLAKGAAKELVDNAKWTKPQLISYSTETQGTSVRMRDTTKGRSLRACAREIVKRALAQ